MAASDDNPYVVMQQWFSKAMIEALDLYRDTRDRLVEQMFHGVYGSPLVQAACGISQSDGASRSGLGCCPLSWRQPRRRNVA